MFPADMMKPILPLRAAAFALLIAVFLAPALASAQVAGASSNFLDTAFLKFFGDHTNFTCKAEFHILDAIKKDYDITPFGFAVSDGKMRMDIDYTQVKGPDVPPAMIPTLKQLGMDQQIMIMRPDKKIMYSVFPRAKAYTEKPMSKEELAAASKTYSVDKSKLGRETIDGHLCDKSTVTLTDEKGAKVTATVWNATDLRGFPVQIQVPEQDTTLVMKFRDVKLAAPDPARFEPPAGLTRYKSDEALMDAATKGTLPK